MTMIWTGGVSLMPNCSSFCLPPPCASSSPCASTAFSSDWGVVYRDLSPASVTACWQRHLKEECTLRKIVFHGCIWNKCFRNFYLPPKKLLEGNVSTGVCHSVRGWVGYASSCDHQVSLAGGLVGMSVGWVCLGGRWVCPACGWVCPGRDMSMGEYVHRGWGGIPWYPPHWCWYTVAATKTCTVAKWVVHILVECFLVWHIIAVADLHGKILNAPLPPIGAIFFIFMQFLANFFGQILG